MVRGGEQRLALNGEIDKADVYPAIVFSLYQPTIFHRLTSPASVVLVLTAAGQIDLFNTRCSANTASPHIEVCELR
ncbi:hypothetical protein KCP76_04300 [Salmonella enterica subsp. enterica serovar Weltevreden]|nr:hypothetical protein KCP76_04300 [Salmonella enterica subsp. enterica serovar Weltevreden]